MSEVIYFFMYGIDPIQIIESFEYASRLNAINNGLVFN
jgi:hypothetical protein